MDREKKTILMTGVTGFVGSALAARWLSHDAKIIALSRNDPTGERTRSAIQDAAPGMLCSIGDDQWERLDVIDVDLAQVESINPERIRDVSVVWHCAAEMSYSNRKLIESFRMNAATTGNIYRLVNTHCPRCERFYYVSTAYTAGVKGGVVEERLHFGVECVNTYQIIKWAAEHMLHNLQLHSCVPVTVFRPSIVVGHPETGWAHRSGFGMYMFVDALTAASEADAGRVTLDLMPNSTPDLVTIDTLVELADTLTQRESGTGLPFEVFHCVGGCQVTVADILTTTGDVVGVEVVFDKPTSQLDQKIDRAIEPNRVFANTVWYFDQSRIQTETGKRFHKGKLDKDVIRKIVHWYRWGELPAAPLLQAGETR